MGDPDLDRIINNLRARREQLTEMLQRVLSREGDSQDDKAVSASEDGARSQPQSEPRREG